METGTLFNKALLRLADSSESLISAEHGCRHETGCADGCLAVHRHSNPEMSRAQLKELQKQKREQKLLEKAALKAAEGIAVAEAANAAEDEPVAATGSEDAAAVP